MKSKFILSIFLSILIGLYIAFHLTLFSGMNPFLDTICLVFAISILIWNLVLIFKNSSKRISFVKLSVLILVLLLAFYKAKTELNSLVEEVPRIYNNRNSEEE